MSDSFNASKGQLGKAIYNKINWFLFTEVVALWLNTLKLLIMFIVC